VQAVKDAVAEDRGAEPAAREREAEGVALVLHLKSKGFCFLPETAYDNTLESQKPNSSDNELRESGSENWPSNK